MHIIYFQYNHWWSCGSSGPIRPWPSDPNNSWYVRHLSSILEPSWSSWPRLSSSRLSSANCLKSGPTSAGPDVACAVFSSMLCMRSVFMSPAVFWCWSWMLGALVASGRWKWDLTISIVGTGWVSVLYRYIYIYTCTLYACSIVYICHINNSLKSTLIKCYTCRATVALQIVSLLDSWCGFHSTSTLFSSYMYIRDIYSVHIATHVCTADCKVLC